jgi:hypothetical protein
MHKKLKVRLWREIERMLGKQLGLRPRLKSANWYVFSRTIRPPCAFVAAEFTDVAGGRFAFYFGVADRDLPKAPEVPERTYHAPVAGGLTMVDAEALGARHALAYVELAWQTPSMELVHRALAIESARSVLKTLGVTRDSGHHLLSHGVIEAIGVEVSDREFDGTVEHFRAVLEKLLFESVVPAFRELERRWKS